MAIIYNVLYLLQAWIFSYIRRWFKPTSASVTTNMTLPCSELMLENAMLRKQLIILSRQVERPKMSNSDRRWLVIIASKFQNWRQALLIVQPETLLRWRRELFRAFWRYKTRTKQRKPRIRQETIDLIQAMTKDNLLGVQSVFVANYCISE